MGFVSLTQWLLRLLAPFFVSMLSRVWLKETLPKYTWLSIGFTLIGTVLLLSGEMGGDAFSHLTLGDALGMSLQVVSTFCLAVFLILVKRSAANYSRGDVLLSQFLAVIFLSPVCSVAIGDDWGVWNHLEAQDWVLVVVFGFGVFSFGNAFQITG